MPAPDFTIKAGNTAPSLSATLQDAAGVAVDITGATVAFRMKPMTGGGAIISHAAVVVSAVAGTVRYDWQTGDTATPGYYQAEFRTTFANGSIQSFPSEGFILVLVQVGLT